MNQKDADVIAIVQRLKERALASPWVPLGVPPQEHFHMFPNGLSLCFTQDVIPEARYWHLSIARAPDGATPEETEFWRRAFFEEEPTIQWPSRLFRQFYWRIGDG